MGKRGPQPKNRISIEWSANLAYAIGLLVTDGCLYNDGRHISLTTKDWEQAENFKHCLGLSVKTGKKSNGRTPDKNYFHVQFGGVIFYNFLLSIGLTSAKSKTIGVVDIPSEYFFDFLRGCFDGDGCFYSYWDKRWASSHMFYLEFCSASIFHINWLQEEIFKKLAIMGHCNKVENNSAYRLRYAKREALEIIKKMYYSGDVVYLSRKKLKIEKALKIEKEQQKLYS